MTDKEIMFHRFSRKNIRKNTGLLAQMLGIPRKEYEAACRTAMEFGEIPTLHSPTTEKTSQDALFGSTMAIALRMVQIQGKGRNEP